MERKSYMLFLRYVPNFTVAVIVAVSLILYPQKFADGIKSGLLLLAGNIIPSLFPFMVLSSYIAQCPFTEFIARISEKPCNKLFKTNGYGVCAVILGMLGGYPIGAKTVAEFYQSGKITKNEAERLFNWCINPGPAFVITSVGSFMLSSFRSGLILYLSTLLSSFVIGVVMRFLGDGSESVLCNEAPKATKGGFVNSVSVGSEAMLSVCGWVLTFSGLSVLTDILVANPKYSLLVKAILEVTTGCVNAAENELSLPIISAILGFGGFAVIFQVGRYMYICGVQLKQLLCARIVNSALNAFFCAQLVKLFPQSEPVFSSAASPHTALTFSHSFAATVVLIIMCIVLILEVDNKKKMC